ncbi:hypothetical protein PILCRDRAFT_5480 [Piloderma croceum F 1598]|uniref:Uncharacterized protein n=1 Tax=Piloderma croceum (strain F 1598) TaxID=765440 RepID=A0A0C3G5D6_PILCF|nr:hypothetical protein PILCRDRAFT_5480 [Piloderma croceum F 1598]
MILGLLDELHGDQSSVVRGFLAVLQDHPVVVHERASVPPLHRSTESESAEPTGSSKVFEDTEHATRKRTRGGGNSGINCCRNGVKRVSLATRSTRHSKRLRRENTPRAEPFDGLTDNEDVLMRSVPADADNIQSDDEEDKCEMNGRVTRGRGKGRIVSAGDPEGKGAVKDAVVTNGLQKKQTDGKAKSKRARKRAGKCANEGGSRWSMSLVDLVLLFIQPGETACDRLEGDCHPLSLGGVIASCAEAQSRLALADFHHMISLIRLAFHFDRELAAIEDSARKPTVVSVARRFEVDERCLWHWYNQGTFYVLIIITALGLKSELLKRDINVDVLVDSVSFVLRNPEDSGLSEPLIKMVSETLIPQIQLLRNFKPLQSILRFDVFPPHADGSLDAPLCFFDVENMDVLTSTLQTK